MYHDRFKENLQQMCVKDNPKIRRKEALSDIIDGAYLLQISS